MAHTALRAMAVLSLGLLWGPAYAQDPVPLEDDPPERAARLSHIEGEVSLQPVDAEEWAPAYINRPLTTGDKLWTERAARAEIQVGPATIHLDDETGFSFLDVDADTIQMRLTAGVINVTVRRLDGSEQIEIATPNVALSLLREGSYRVEVNDAGDATVVKVRGGAAEATGTGEELVVHAGQAVTFTGTDDVVAQINTLGERDGFDAWSEERDRRDQRLASSRTAEYVSPDVTGYEDLDEYGTWSSEADYGHVWTPRYVAADWAPYRYGRWVWVSPWGWTWIDDARWGYAPFHYGRWAHIRNRWCWVPGPRHIRAVYAPALVGWVGYPGSHAWYPLSPRDVYRPWRRHSWRYFERSNISNTSRLIRSHIREAYDRRESRPRHRGNAPIGVTAASRAAFTSGGHVRDHRVRVNDRELSRGIAIAAAPQIEPGRESRLGSSRANVRVPPRTIADRQVVVRRTPPAVASRFTRAPSQRPVVAPTARLGVTPSARPDVVQSPQRPGRVQSGQAVRDRMNDRMSDRMSDRMDRPDRPPRGSRPTLATSPQSQPAPSSMTQAPQATGEQHGRIQDGMGNRLRQARERQLRDDRPSVDASQQHREFERRERDTQVQQRWRTQQNNEVRQPREQPQARDMQQRMRERVQQQDHRQVERRVESRPVERPQVSSPRPQARPQMERPRVETPKPAPPSNNSAPKRSDSNFSRQRRN